MTMYKFPLIRVHGSNYDMGFQHGRICEGKIKKYLRIWAEVVQKITNKRQGETIKQTELFIPFIKKYTPDLAEEIKGLSAGAGISLAEAYMLQIRFELIFTQLPADFACTSYAVAGSGTEDGRGLIGQNVDAQAGIEDFGIMLHATPDECPATLIYTSVGQIGYLGVNSAGLGVYGNMCNVVGWRPGVPRYLLLRRILQNSNIVEAMKVFDIPRGASLNYIMHDATGRIVNVETTVDEHRVFEPSTEQGFFVHANHYLHPDFAPRDTMKTTLPDSPGRQERINKLISEEISVRKKKMTVEKMHDILSDHDNFPAAICRHPVLGDPIPGTEAFADIKTLCSIISKPSAGETYITVGNPCENERFLYEL